MTTSLLPWVKCAQTGHDLVPWKIPSNIVCDINKLLYKKVEWSGVIKFKNMNNTLHATGHTKQAGQEASVSTPSNTAINWHSHPIICYINEKTIWGWPSGEDARECLRFSLQGNNLAHFVFAVEGIYSVQVNPCVSIVLKSIQRKDADEIRGIIFAIVELYFKATHIFRTEKTFKEFYEATGQIITPDEYTKYINSFNLSKILKAKKSYKCKGLNCGGGFPGWDSGSYEQLSLNEMIKFYGHAINFYKLNEFGQGYATFRPSIKKIRQALLYVEKSLAALPSNLQFKYKPCISGPCTDCHENVKIWAPDQWFNVCLFYNKTYLDNNNKLKFGHSSKKAIQILTKCTSIKCFKNSPVVWHYALNNKCL